MDLSNDDYTQLPGDKAELMRRIDREWEALQQAIAGLSEAQMSVPDAGGWAIKDNLAHVTFWERYLRLHHLRNLPAHEVMEVDADALEKMDQDQENAVIFERNKDRPLAEILSELEDSHALVLSDLERVSFDQMMAPDLTDGLEKRPLMASIAGNTYEHYLEHRLSIEKNPGRRGE